MGESELATTRSKRATYARTEVRVFAVGRGDERAHSLDVLGQSLELLVRVGEHIRHDAALWLLCECSSDGFKRPLLRHGVVDVVELALRVHRSDRLAQLLLRLVTIVNDLVAANRLGIVAALPSNANNVVSTALGELDGVAAHCRCRAIYEDCR